MATMTCTGAGCGAELGPADMMCSSCGTPRPRARRPSHDDRRRSPSAEGGHRPVPGSATQPGAVSDGAVSDGAVSDGAVSDGAVSDGAVSDGAGSDGARVGGDCDHRDNEPGAIICSRCAVPLNCAAKPSSAVARRYRIETPWGGFLLDDPETDVGRKAGPFSKQLAGHMTVSRRHATLRITSSGRLHVIDHNSSNGTWKNGRRLDPNVAVELRDGDTVSFSTALRFMVRAEGADS